MNLYLIYQIREVIDHTEHDWRWFGDGSLEVSLPKVIA